jgi:hypothetical protein
MWYERSRDGQSKPNTLFIMVDDLGKGGSVGISGVRQK